MKPLGIVMRCWIYKGDRRPETYLYLAERDAFETAPEALIEVMGRLELVMELELSPQRNLARARAADVMRELEEKGFFLQLPPTEGPDSVN